MFIADVSVASMLWKSFPWEVMHTQFICIDETSCFGVYGLIVSVDVEQHRCQYTSLYTFPADLCLC